MSRTSFWSILSFVLAFMLTIWLSLKSLGIQFGTTLEIWQQDRAYKNITGVIFLSLILSQWILSISRTIYKTNGEAWQRIKEVHLIVGMLTLIMAFLHAWNLGFGLLFFLMGLFILNTLVSSVYTLKSEGVLLKNIYLNFLLPGHIIFSVAITLLSLMHWWLVMTFN